MAKSARCIGINDYQGTGSDLSGCVNDANDWAAALRERGFTVEKLLNKSATWESIRAAIKSLVSGAATGDTFDASFQGWPNGAFTFAALGALEKLSSAPPIPSGTSPFEGLAVTTVRADTEPLWIVEYETMEGAGLT